MKSKSFKIVIGILIILGLIYLIYFFVTGKNLKFLYPLQNLSTIFFSSKPLNDKINILIVPGHEPDQGGAQFKNIYERDLAVEIAQDLQKFLSSNSHYNVSITRDANSWNPTFENYFTKNWDSIIEWKKTSKINASNLIPIGESNVPPVLHNKAPEDVAVRLYGITKWANENNVDLMIHIHINDYPRHNMKIAGKYSGLTIYTPASYNSNNQTTRAIAETVFNRLSLYNPTSSLPVESAGIIDDPKLIAVGVDNTAKAASMLIEYDYIYEPQFVNEETRSLALNDLAYQTSIGLGDFFAINGNFATTSDYNPSKIYSWNTPVIDNNSDPKDIYATQTALMIDGVYPPTGKTKNECPHSGAIGSCTNSAIKEFQNKYGITGENISGKKTFELLQKIYNGGK